MPYETRFALAAALALPACHVIDEFVPQAPVELASDTRLPEDAPGFESATVTDDAIVYQFAAGSEGFAFERGQILVGASEGGYLRRVEGVERDGDTIVAHTSPAALTDVLERGELAIEASSSGVSADVDCPPGATCRAVDIVDLTGEVLFDGEIDGVPVVVEITRGSVRFDPTVAVDVAISRGRIDGLSVIADGVLDAELDLRAQAGGPFQLEQEIDLSGPGVPFYTQPFTVFLPTPLGPLPVAGRLDVEVFAGVVADVSAEAELVGGVEARVGARYEAEAWQTIGEPTIVATPHDPVLTGAADADLTGYLRPEVRLYLYGVLGPVVSLEPSLHVVGASAPPAEPELELDGCLAGALAFELDVFSARIADYHDSLEACTPLYPR